jgi:pentatricopeptide repeat protein
MHTHTQQGKQYDKAIGLLDQMVRDGVRPNDLTFAAVIQACGEGQRWGEAESMMATMRANGVPVTHQVMNTVNERQRRGALQYKYSGVCVDM